MNNEYNPHLLEWSDEKVGRFWNFYNNYPPYNGTWFTEVAGNLVLKFVSRHIAVTGKLLDYGTGKGFLLQHLLSNYNGIELYACDFTDSVAKETGEKFRQQHLFKGCRHITRLPSAYEADFFDIVFLVETIEHLTDNYLHATMNEIYRVLKPGGHVVITTPNDESIEKNYVHCADCGATFHHMQHVRSWNVQTLGMLTGQFGFKSVACKAINLKWYQKKGMLHRMADNLKKIMGSVKPENLVYIGKKQ